MSEPLIKFYVLWVYMANASTEPHEVWETTPERAAERVKAGYSKDFRRKATLFVFDHPPAAVIAPHPRRAEFRNKALDQLWEIPPHEERKVEGLLCGRSAGDATKVKFTVGELTGLFVTEAADEIAEKMIESLMKAEGA